MIQCTWKDEPNTKIQYDRMSRNADIISHSLSSLKMLVTVRGYGNIFKSINIYIHD